ncbi:unnamed protein product [Cuscuta campestris]|uniref:Uncharacterized protein n=1 Tax=Cuscuta campestris TaxID=132261 RepID=A0A484MEL5_9ASTE|nr:unnamed protein product [Cuscuta campestris]
MSAQIFTSPTAHLGFLTSLNAATPIAFLCHRLLAIFAPPFVVALLRRVSSIVIFFSSANFWDPASSVY